MNNPRDSTEKKSHVQFLDGLDDDDVYNCSSEDDSEDDYEEESVLEEKPRKRRRVCHRVDEEYEGYSEMVTVQDDENGNPLDITLFSGGIGLEKLFKMQVLEQSNKFVLFSKKKPAGVESYQKTPLKSFDTLQHAMNEYKSILTSKLRKGYRVRSAKDDPLHDPDDYSSEEEIETSITDDEKINFLVLPLDVQLMVFEFCGCRELTRLCMLNRKFNNLLSATDRFWITQYQRFFNRVPDQSKQERNFISDPTSITNEELQQKVGVYYLDDRTRAMALLSLDILQKLLSRMSHARHLNIQRTGNDPNVYPSMNAKTLFQRTLSERSRKKLRTKSILMTSESNLSYEELMNRFLKMRHLTKIERLDIQSWIEEDEFCSVVESIVDNKNRLSHLKALSIADVDKTLCEIDWIELGDITPIIEALPGLIFFDLKGSKQLKIAPITHSNLLSLSLVTSGLPSDVMKGIFRSNLPNLSYLALYLGTEESGADSIDKSKEALRILLTEEETGIFPSLQHLGLLNSAQIDHFCDILVSSALVRRILHLDLSFGCLGDSGFAELLKLKDKDTCLLSIDVAHNYIVKPTLVDELLNMDIFIKNLDVDRQLGRIRYPAILR